jgi:hypothetical protein
MNTNEVRLISAVLEHPERYLIDSVWQSKRELFSGQVAEAVNILDRFVFSSEAIAYLHRQQIRYPLIEKHSVPYLFALQDFGGDVHGHFDRHVLAGCLAVHTLALTQLDYHMDGIDPPTDESCATATRVGLEEAVAYAVAVMYRGMAEICQSPYGSQVVSEVVGPVSGFTAERMYEDYRDRHAEFYKALLEMTSSAYLENSFSRILASGYWELMIHAAAICASAEFNREMARFCIRLRTLRQVVDEWTDIEEDVSSGLVTLPAIMAREIYRRDTGSEPLSTNDNADRGTFCAAYATWAREFSARQDFIAAYDAIVFDLAEEALSIAATYQWPNLAALVHGKVAKYLTDTRRATFSTAQRESSQCNNAMA